MQRTKQPLSTAIPGEHATRSVRTMSTRGEPEDEDSCEWIAETGDGLAPVVVVRICGAFVLGDLRTPLDEPWTLRTGMDVTLELDQR